MFSKIEGASRVASGLRWDLALSGLYPPVAQELDVDEAEVRRAVVRALRGVSWRDLLGLLFTIEALKSVPPDTAFLQFYQRPAVL